MAKTTAPLLSFAGSGQIGKAQVYSTWRGISYARRYLIPANPNSTGQQETRSVFTFLSNTWKQGASALQAPWTAFAKGQKFYNRNAFMGANTKILRPGTDMTGFQVSPGAGGGLAPASVSASVASSTATVTVTPPTAPTGWTVTGVSAVAMPNTDPHSATVFTSYSGSASASPWEVTLSSLPSGSYIVGGYVTYSKPDGSTAYGPSSNTTFTVT